MKQTTTNRYMQFIKDNKIQLIIILSLFCICVLPMINKGVSSNDDLVHRYYAMRGDAYSYMQAVISNNGGARIISTVLNPILIMFAYISSNKIIFGMLTVLTIASNVGFFGIFLYKIFKNKNFSFFTVALFIVSITAWSEYSLPNAYSVYFGIPISILFISFILFVDYLEKEKIRYLISSVVLFFTVLIVYELFITFTPIFLVLTLWKHKDIKNIIKKSMLPILSGVIFLALYITLNSLSPATYEGTTIHTSSILNTMIALLQLATSAIPGYTLLNLKYLKAFTSNFHISLILNVSIILLPIITFCGLKYFKNGAGEKLKSSKASNVYIILVAIAYMFLPSLPIALSQKYVNPLLIQPNGLVAYTPTYFITFAVIFLISFISWKIFELGKPKLNIAIIALVSLYTIPIFIMNSNVLDIQSKDYNSIIYRESLFDTQIAKDVLTGKTLYSNTFTNHDLNPYIGLEALGYFEYYIYLNIPDSKYIADIPADIPADAAVLYFDGNIFTLRSGEDIYVLSGKRLKGIHPVQISEKEFLAGDFIYSKQDNKLFLSQFKVLDNELVPVVLYDEPMFPDKIGSDMSSMKKINGIHPDGWLEQKSSFAIKTLDVGKLDITGYYPWELKGNEIISIYVNGEKKLDYNVETPGFEINLDVPKNEVITVHIETNFLANGGGDPRELSFVMTAISAS